MKPILLLTLFVLATAPYVRAQGAELSAAPEVAVRLDEVEYAVFQPVLVTVEMTNGSGEPQPFGAAHPVGSMHYKIMGPDRAILPLHVLFQDILYTSLDTYAPGERRTVTFNLLRYFPASAVPGSHELEVQYVPPNGPPSTPVTVEYTVVSAGEAAGLDSLRRAAESVWSLKGWSPASAYVPEPTLEALSADPALPEYARQLASYLLILAAEIDAAFGFGTQDAVAERRTAFLKRYPRSVYAHPAEWGYAAALATDGADAPSVSPFESLTAAVVVVGETSATFNGTSFTISGAPTDMGGATTGKPPAHGISTAATNAVRAALSPQQAARVTGVGPAPDIVTEPLTFDAAAWADDLAARASVTLGSRPSGAVGTEAAPVVAYAPSGVRLSGGFRGVGVLIVDGAFEMRGDAEWRGLVVVRGSSDQQADPTLSGSPRILGALLVLPGESGSPAVLRLSGRVSILYSPQALDLARTAASDS